MIRRDFEKGGFPINRKNPVLCFAEDHLVHIAYDRYTLNQILKIKSIMKCIGVWVGKYETDCFPLNPSSYIGVSPPKEHKDIDSASDIRVIFNGEGTFVSMSYPSLTDESRIVSEDPVLFKYLNDTGLPHKIQFESAASSPILKI